MAASTADAQALAEANRRALAAQADAQAARTNADASRAAQRANSQAASRGWNPLANPFAVDFPSTTTEGQLFHPTRSTVPGYHGRVHTTNFFSTPGGSLFGIH